MCSKCTDGWFLQNLNEKKRNTEQKILFNSNVSKKNDINNHEHNYS